MSMYLGAVNGVAASKLRQARGDVRGQTKELLIEMGSDLLGESNFSSLNDHADFGTEDRGFRVSVSLREDNAEGNAGSSHFKVHNVIFGIADW